VQAAAEEGIGQVELFMNSVPLLGNLTREQKLQLVDAFTEEAYEGGWPSCFVVSACHVLGMVMGTSAWCATGQHQPNGSAQSITVIVRWHWLMAWVAPAPHLLQLVRTWLWRAMSATSSSWSRRWARCRIVHADACLLPDAAALLLTTRPAATLQQMCG
jgi:hypothetical protein